jgi:hypothetical protein
MHDQPLTLTSGSLRPGIGPTHRLTPDDSTEGAPAPSLLPSPAQHSTHPAPEAPMPTAYELMEAYRTWWRASYSTSPNSQAVILAAAWAEHVLTTYRAGEDATPPPGAAT